MAAVDHKAFPRSPHATTTTSRTARASALSPGGVEVVTRAGAPTAENERLFRLGSGGATCLFGASAIYYYLQDVLLPHCKCVAQYG